MAIFLIVSLVTYSMDDPNFKKSDGSNPSKIIAEVSPSSGKQKKMIPSLNFAPRTRNTKSVSKGTPSSTGDIFPKTPINTVAQLEEVIGGNKIAGQTTQRRQNAGGSGLRRRRSVGGNGDAHRDAGSDGDVDDVRITMPGNDQDLPGLLDIPDPSRVTLPMSPKKNPSLVPTAITRKLVMHELLDQRRQYSEDEVWQMLEKFSPTLHRFGQQHSLALDELGEYAEMLRKSTINPEALLDFIKKHTPEDQNPATLLDRTWSYIPFIGSSKDEAFVLREYNKIKSANPEEYEALVLDFIKQLCDKSEGQQNYSPLAHTHIGLQNAELANQKRQNRQQWIAFIFTTAVSAGMTIWAAYGQINSQSCSNSTS